MSILASSPARRRIEYPELAHGCRNLAAQQGGSYLGYTGRGADAFAKTARHPQETLRAITVGVGWARRTPSRCTNRNSGAADRRDVFRCSEVCLGLIASDGLTDRSRRPYRHASQLPVQIEMLRCKQDKHIGARAEDARAAGPALSGCPHPGDPMPAFLSGPGPRPTPTPAC